MAASMPGHEKYIRKLREKGIKPNPGRWEVLTKVSSDSIHVSVSKGLMYFVETGSWYIYPPNWLERLFGITLESKLKKAHGKAIKFAYKLNKKDNDFAEAVKNI